VKKILGIDLGTKSIGWALVNEAENNDEKSSIIRLGVRVISYDNFVSTDTRKESKEPEKDFAGGKGISPNAGRTLKRCMRRNLQRYKLRRENLIEILTEHAFISDESILSENGNHTTFETCRLRAKAATEEISLEQFARVLLMINKKRGYKSSRKAKNQDDGQIIDGMEVAQKLYNEELTPGQLCLQLLEKGQKTLPDFYRSDLQSEFDRIWTKQKDFYPEILTNELKGDLVGKNKKQTWAVFAKPFQLVGIKRETKYEDQKKENYAWRVNALSVKMGPEELAIILQEINAQISNSSGYLGKISDRSKELFFYKQTVGQYQMAVLDKNPNASLKNMVFYRQDYLDEFNKIWDVQSKFHKELDETLKQEIRDVVIFYQRKLKSQNGLIGFCEFESRKKEFEVDGKKKVKIIGSRVIPRSSPLFQEFKIWQILNNIELTNKNTGEINLLSPEQKVSLFQKLQNVERLSDKEALNVLFDKSAKNYKLNYEKIEGNKTRSAISNILGDSDLLSFDFEKEQDSQPLYKLWHLLYSYEDDNSASGNDRLIEILGQTFKLSTEIAKKLANISFQDDYGSLSAKAIRKILPFLKEGHQYDVACEYAGYKHSASSLTKEEIEHKTLKNKLEILPKNALRNPVVEKILNQMANVTNAIIETYGKPDEIRIELARELKKSAKEREQMTLAISENTKDREEIVKKLKNEFGLHNPSGKDIIRYKLYRELAANGYKTLYSDTYIAQEELFSKNFDIEHIIPQARLFDDSFANKTLEKRDVNIKKGSTTAYDFVRNEYGEDKAKEYLLKVEKLMKDKKISKTKYKHLIWSEKDIPDSFIDRDIRETQYIAKYAKSMLNDLVKYVVSTTGSITDRLREDWQLIDVMKELNWDKYQNLGLTEEYTNEEGHKIRKIKDWTKRNDHRHHAMDALTVAFSKRSIIQYLNNLSARITRKCGCGYEKYGLNTEEYTDWTCPECGKRYFTRKDTNIIYAIERNELYRNDKGKLIFKPPFALNEFRAEAKKQLENTLISIKARNKVVTQNINTSRKKSGTNKKIQQTPRGQLHNETIYGSQKIYVANEEAVNAKFDETKISTVSRPVYREALLKRLRENGNDPKKAFTGKNSLAKNPIYLDGTHTKQVPEKVKTVSLETIYTIRKEISPDMKLDKVIDEKIKLILKKRLEEFNGDAKKAFTNLDEKPIWQNEEKGIAIKCVTIKGISNAEPLHTKKDKDGNDIPDKNGNKQPIDFISTANNHHVAIYRDSDGNLKEKMVSFLEAVRRANAGLPIIDRGYKQSEGWTFLFTMKQNEYFVFPNEQTGFNPKEIDLMNPEIYHLISPNLFRVQKIATKDYCFRHHLETSVANDLKDITFKRLASLSFTENVVKVRINHIGQIIHVGEY